MEHRHYPRIETSLEVDVLKKGRHIGSATTKDISLGGMRLQNDEPLLNQNDVILLRIRIHGEEQTLSGFVIHSSKHSTGIMLIGMSKDVTRAYFNFLRDMETPLRMALNQSEKSANRS